MGSIDKACIAGFLCRLCSEMHRTVIHIYGDQGQKHGLVEKINGYLPITITPTDPLPKTICESCLRRVEQHYELLVRITQYRESRNNEKRELRPRLFRLNTDDEAQSNRIQSLTRITRRTNNGNEVVDVATRTPFFIRMTQNFPSTSRIQNTNITPSGSSSNNTREDEDEAELT